MLISFCIPIHNRLSDLQEVLPSVIKSAKRSLPVELVILDYNSTDGLEEYVKTIDYDNIIYKKFTGRDYFHMAHAKNLAALAANGEYIVTSNADIFVNEEFFEFIRTIIENTGIPLLRTPNLNSYAGIVVIKKSEFIAAGGIDERFEFYSPDDKDFILRLERRGIKYTIYPLNHLSMVTTPNNKKVKNYRLKISKRAMAKLMVPIYEENIKNNVLVANPKGWGKWNI